jgi:predicted ester cyclase
MATTQELHKKLSQAFNGQDEKGIRAVCSPNMEFVAPGDMTGKGVDAYVEFCRGWWTAFPDAKTRTDRLHVTDDAFIEEGTFIGTHTGVLRTPMGDIPPTRKRVEGRYNSVFACTGDQITSEHLVFDRMQLMEQLGLAPAPATARG